MHKYPKSPAGHSLQICDKHPYDIVDNFEHVIDNNYNTYVYLQYPYINWHNLVYFQYIVFGGLLYG